jgi:uncharacterized membrane-anchored protein
MTRRHPTAGLFLRLLFLAALATRILAQNADADGKQPSEAELKAKYEAAINALPWKKGPGEAKLGDRATIPYGAEYRFLDAKAAVRRLEMSGNRVDADEIMGMIEHVGDKWWVVFQFEEVGYVKDDDKNDLNADKLLKAYRDGVDADNDRRDGPPTKVVGWQVAPKYDEATHNLEWAITFETAGEQYVNHNVRILGRKGIMKVVLVEDMDELAATLPKFRAALATFKFDSGESYGEYRPGDKIAKYGLTALVAGGAALGAAKLGLFAKLGFVFKKFFKFIFIAIIAIGASIKKFFTRSSRE